MSFSQSGNVITQSGTDADLSGLSGLSGVTVTTTNPQSAEDRYDIYVVNSSTQLKITGTLTIEPDQEMLIIEKDPASFGNGAPLLVTSGGILNYGVVKSSAGDPAYSRSIGLQFTNQGATFFNRDGMFIASGGTFNWNGGIIRTASTLTIGDGATCTVNDGRIYNSSNAQNYQFRIEASNTTNSNLVNIYRLVYDGFTRPIRIFTTYSFGTLSPVLARGQVSVFNSASNQPLTFTNFDNAPNAAVNDCLFGVQAPSGGSTVTLQNCSSRPSFDTAVGATTNGYYRTLRQMDAPVVDLGGTALTYSYYGVDTNNGGRGVAPNGTDDTADKVYEAVGATGNFNENLLVETDRMVNGVFTFDDRANASDTIPVRFISYAEAITTFEPELIGLQSDTRRIVMLPDASVSQSTRATVDAYATLDDANEFYDRAKSYLVDNYAGETATLVSRDGTSIDAGAFNVTLDATAASAFAVSGSTITIKSSRYTGNITTTGTITLSNGAVAIGTLTDTNGTTTTTTLSFTGLKANTEVRVYAAGTATEVAGVENSGTSESFDISESSVDVVIHALGYLNQVLESVDTTGNVALPITQVLDRQYDNP